MNYTTRPEDLIGIWAARVLAAVGDDYESLYRIAEIISERAFKLNHAKDLGTTSTNSLKDTPYWPEED